MVRKSRNESVIERINFVVFAVINDDINLLLFVNGFSNAVSNNPRTIYGDRTFRKIGGNDVIDRHWFLWLVVVDKGVVGE